MQKLTYLLGAMLTVIWVLGACMPSQHEMEMASAMEIPTHTLGEITVVHTAANATPEGAPNGAAYLVILNGTDSTVRLVGIASDVAEKASLHESIDDNGIMRMLPRPEGFEIDPGGQLVLEPGGKHIMLEKLYAPLQAESAFTVTLTFEDAEPMDVTIPVMQVGGMMDHQ